MDANDDGTAVWKRRFQFGVEKNGAVVGSADADAGAGAGADAEAARIVASPSYASMKDPCTPTSAPTNATRRLVGAPSASGNRHVARLATMRATAPAHALGDRLCASSQHRLNNAAMCVTAARVRAVTCLSRMTLTKSFVGGTARDMESTTLTTSACSNARDGSAEKRESNASPTSYALTPSEGKSTTTSASGVNARAILANPSSVRTPSNGTLNKSGASSRRAYRCSVMRATTAGTFGGKAVVGSISNDAPNAHGAYDPDTETKKSRPPSKRTTRMASTGSGSGSAATATSAVSRRLAAGDDVTRAFGPEDFPP